MKTPEVWAHGPYRQTKDRFKLGLQASQSDLQIADVRITLQVASFKLVRISYYKTENLSNMIFRFH